ncbi:MAG: DNA replication/repair protein RecF [Alphaproteobacteria bacterium]|nr:MAG: DNA replication/repair protein RecF [Alphaproteobacteria bacterium]
MAGRPAGCVDRKVEETGLNAPLRERTGPSRFILAGLRLVRMRNLADGILPLDGRRSNVLVLVGPNGAGKTSLLEAVSLLAPGRGLRGARFAELLRFGEDGHLGWRVEAALDTPHAGRHELVVAGRVTEGAGAPAADADEPGEEEAHETVAGFRRLIEIDGRRRSPAALGGIARVLWLTPAMDRLFAGPAAERRRFLDRVVLTLHPGNARLALAFERTMRARNRLLGEAGVRADASWLAALEAKMAEAATAIAAARVEAVAQWSAMLAHRPLDGFPSPLLGLAGTLEEQLAAGAPALEVEEAYREALAAGRARDAEAGRTLTGPHRTDLRVAAADGGNEGQVVPAHFCSTGEQKALLLALVLGHAELIAGVEGAAPILLLDEVAAHVDEDRRSRLFARLAALDGEVWVTGTDEAVFAPLIREHGADRWQVAEGCIRP